ncbi:L-lactate dehydrogenase [Actinomyces haliotis]|uniref:L-lactate dehydrogenase n=1 Tax=Actinomyces haliotis TaxID=1280843 RepID=UPI00188E76F3|nr:L-lactate dehydrogenase [Actinomyces haliotis]
MSEAVITNSAQGSYPVNPGGRPSKVAIIGAGAVGSTLAYACVTKGVAREVVLQDIAKEKVEAEALDIAQGIQFTSAGSVQGSDDPEICRDADVIAITAGAKQKPGQSRLELAGATVGIMEKILPKLVEVAPNAIFLLVANPVDVVTYCSKKITGLPDNQVFGSGTVLDTARMRYLLSLETGTATQNIHGYIAGEHGDSEVALWSSTEIGGVPITQWGDSVRGGGIDQTVLDRVATDVVQSAYRIIDGKGVTNYAVGLAVQRIISAILNDEQRVLTISPVLQDWHGISDVCMSVPTIVGREGAGRRLELPLTDDELTRLTESASRLREAARGLGY